MVCCWPHDLLDQGHITEAQFEEIVDVIDRMSSPKRN